MPVGPALVQGVSRRGHVALWMLFLLLVAFWGAVVFDLLSFAANRVGPLALWGTAALALLILLALAGREINGMWSGVLIDPRNKVSLSRLQITLWTVMVLSAYLTIALPRVRAMLASDESRLSQEQALNISFPTELVLAMGISAASFAGATLIQSNKKTRQLRIDTRTTPESATERFEAAEAELSQADVDVAAKVQAEAAQKAVADVAEAAATAAPTDAARRHKALMESTLHRKLQADKDEAVKVREARRKALETAKEELATINESQGLLHKNADPSEASWADLFRGEEIGNYKQVDMSKVQMLFFTVVVIVAYAAALAATFQDTGKLLAAEGLAFPAFSDSLNALLGISHGTYLSVKSVDHT